MAVVTTNPRVTAADPGAWLDGEPWTFTLNFTNPGSTTPTDLTGSRLYVKFQAQGPAGLVPIQVCDSAASDGSLTIAPGTGGQITVNAVPEARTWTAPRFGPGLLLLPAIVLGDVYRQVSNGEPACLTRLTLRVLPTTGAPTPAPTPPPSLAALSLSSTSAIAGAMFLATISGQTNGSTITATASDGTALAVSGSTLFGTFAAAGTPTVTLTETLAGAAGSPKQTVISITVAGTPSTGTLDFSNPANSGLQPGL